ncbi:MAG TPA: alpha/beta hydrolase [Chloroflexota bacterium]|nr:alpha/beta hydrolase [Chloroflexota bacterium]
MPTLILHRTRERVIPVEGAGFMAERIPGAKLVELPGVDHQSWLATWRLWSTRSRNC